MLQHYYDVRAKEKFDALFGDLYIGKHPTKDRNSYLVIKLNFSGISGDLHSYRKGLDEHCRIVFDYFCDVYADYLPEGIKEKWTKKTEPSANSNICLRSAPVSIKRFISSLMNTTISPIQYSLMSTA